MKRTMAGNWLFFRSSETGAGAGALVIFYLRIHGVIGYTLSSILAFGRSF